MESDMAEIDNLEVGTILVTGECSAPVNVRHYAMMTAAMGIVHSVLLLLAYGLIATRAPGMDASDAEFLAFYEDPDERRIVLLAGLYLIPFSGIAFIWFTVSLRMWLTGSVHQADALAGKSAPGLWNYLRCIALLRWCVHVCFRGFQ